MNVYVMLGAAISACGAVFIRTLWDLKTKAPLSRKWIGSLRVLFVLLSAMTVVGAWWSFKQSEQSAVRSRDNLARILQEVRIESRRLLPRDFQIRVYALERGARLDNERKPLPPVHVSGYLGSAALAFELSDLGPGSDDPVRGGRGAVGGSAARFASLNMTVFNLEDYPFLDSLNGQTLTLTLPIQKMQPADVAWHYTVDLFIRGRLFSALADGEGKVQIKIEGL
jgi:hypothetical protein